MVLFLRTVAPSILSPLQNVTLLRGERLNLTCSVDGDPLPTVQWTKDGNTSIPSAQFTQGNSILVIASVQIPDEGLYECTARSRARVDSSKANVKVQGTPSIHFACTLTVFRTGLKLVICQ